MPLRQKSVPALPSSLNLTGKTALVTGANRALGFATCQRQETGEAAKVMLLQGASLRQRLSRQPVEISVRKLDMESLASVVALVDGLATENIPIHIALLNAGIWKMKWAITPETGYETVFRVSYLSTAVLTLFLLPILVRTSEATSARSVLTVVGSELQSDSSWKKKKTAPPSIFSEFANEATFSGFQRYPDSKYLLFQFVHRLAREIDRTKVNVLAVGPGAVGTSFGGNNMPRWVTPLQSMYKAWARKPEEGARVITYASSGLAGDAAHGEFVETMAINPILSSVNTVQGQKIGEMLWAETLQVVQILKPLEDLGLRI